MSFFKKKIVTKKSPTITKEFVPPVAYFFFKLCSRLSTITLIFNYINSSKLTSTDEKCDNARVY